MAGLLVELFPEGPECICNAIGNRSNRGNALQALGLTDEAVASHRRALAVRPGYALAHNNLGTCLRAQGRLDEALAHLREAIRLQPDFAEAHNNLGVVYKSGGRLDEALAH